MKEVYSGALRQLSRVDCVHGEEINPLNCLSGSQASSKACTDIRT